MIHEWEVSQLNVNKTTRLTLTPQLQLLIQEENQVYDVNAPS